MTKDKALRLALEALEQWNTPLYKRGTVINAIKEALETKDEPVAYINVEERKLEWANKFITWETPTVVNLPKIPLYTTPQRTWIGLTGEEKYKLFHSPLPLMALIEEIEYKLKQKNT
jgi:hypothetical protein